MSTVLQAHQLSKTFISQTGGHQKIEALRNVSLTVAEGEILGILGPNGAGKTTFLNILSTLLTPDSGSFEILGIRGSSRNYSLIRQHINMCSGHPNFAWSLTVRENLIFYGRLYGLSGWHLGRKLDDLISVFHLEGAADRRFDELSSGTKQRLSLAKAFLNDPRVLFLDEPTVGLDPDAAIAIRGMVEDLIKSRKVTVLLTTHNMAEAELMCQRVAFIKSGRIIRLASPRELKRWQGRDNLEEVFIDLARLQEERPERVFSQEGEDNGPGGAIQVTVPPWSLVRAIKEWINRAWAFTYRNSIFAIRNFFAFAEMIFWPSVTLLSIGLLGNYLELERQALTFILSGAIVGGVLQVAQLDVSYSLLYEVWSKSLKHTLLTPVGLSENLCGSWLVGIVRGMAVFFMLAAAAMLIFGFQLPGWGVTTVFLAGIFGSAILLGMLVSFLILYFGQKAEITAWMFAYVIMLLGGIYYPITTLPPFFYSLAQWIPVTYFLEYYRSHIGFEPVFSHLLWKGFGLTVFYFCAGHALLGLAMRQARQNGNILRMSE